MNMYNRIAELCKEKGTSVTELCRQTDIPRATLSDYKLGRVKTLTTSVLAKIATFLDVSTDYLLGLTDEKKGYAPQSPEEERDTYPEPVIQFVDILMKLPQEKQTEIVNYMEYLLSKNPPDKK